MTRQSTGIAVLLAAVGMLAGLLGMEIKDLESWVFLTTPAFVGKLFIHVAAVIAAFVGGQVLPTMDKLKG